MSKNASESKKELNRDNLIVPEQIFAPEPEPEEPVEEELVDACEKESADVRDPELDPNQISFFDTDAQCEEDDDTANEDAHRRSEELARLEAIDEKGYDSDKPRIVDKIFDVVELLVFTVAAVFILTSFFFKHAIVDGDSMLSTLAEGEHLIISDLFYEPERGDIIVFEDYTIGENLKKPIVKRVIALAGDKVEIDILGTVFVNGEKIKDEHKYISGGVYELRIEHKYAVAEEYTVPEGHIFVLGDNRNNSTDSRTFGAISTDTVLGEVKLRVFPLAGFGTVD
ncbi:MAG: signal peptidase I [Clostridia bacterium]|nr:signal peptidase I [Clostridia bacterium]